MGRQMKSRKHLRKETTEEAEEEPEQEEIEELTFVPQLSDEEVDFVEGENEITDNILSFVDEHNEELGEAGEVSVDLSNEIIYPQDQSDLRGIVLVSNRSDEPVSNFGFDVTIESDEGTTFAEDQTVFLTEEHFGVLEPNTVMPVYVEALMDEETQQIQSYMYEIENEEWLFTAEFTFSEWNEVGSIEPPQEAVEAVEQEN